MSGGREVVGAEADERLLVSYDQSAKHDVLLAQWWARMAESGDIDRAFQSDLFPLGRS